MGSDDHGVSPPETFHDSTNAAIPISVRGAPLWRWSKEVSSKSAMATHDEDPFEFRRRLALFHDVYANGNVCFALLHKSSLKRSPLVVIGPQTSRVNRFTHRPQKSNRAFRDD